MTDQERDARILDRLAAHFLRKTWLHKTEFDEMVDAVIFESKNHERVI